MSRWHGPAFARRLLEQGPDAGEAGRNMAERLGQTTIDRPAGPLLWVHAPRGMDPGALTSLAARLADDLPDTSLLLTAPTAPATGSAADRESVRIIHQLPPMNSRGPVRRFLDHWKPDAAVWLERVDDPLLLESAAGTGIPLFLQDARSPDINGPRARKAQRHLLGMFKRILAVSPADADRIRSVGAAPTRTEVTGQLAMVHQPPGCSESERGSLARVLGARPVWLAACPPEEELDAVVQAQLHGRRSLHRLLLILVPPSDALGQRYAADLKNRGFAIARRDAYEDPDEATEIFMADFLDEIGLFYRLAPVTYLGGTFTTGAIPQPMDPATLGSAILTGPEFGDRAPDLNRLRAAGACRIVHQPADLGPTVLDLITPDKAAMLALKAWDVASDGALVLERLAGLVTTALRNRAQ